MVKNRNGSKSLLKWGSGNRIGLVVVDALKGMMVNWKIPKRKKLVVKKTEAEVSRC